MKRNKHSLSHYKLLSCDMGELIPVGLVEVLPGDSFQHSVAALVRASPLLAPVMHPVTVRFHSWFVPHRLIWDDWEAFITGGEDGEGDGKVFPTITVNTGSGWASGSLADYLGIPTGVDDQPVSALPFRAYSLIWNEFYRDRDIQTAITVDTTDGADTTTNTTLQKICWEKDYFTAARPWAQRGDEITLPLGTEAPVVYSHENTNPWLSRRADTGALSGAGAARGLGINSAANGSDLFQETDNVEVQLDPAGNLLTDLSTATAVDVNTVRRAFALQRWQEARALYGSRYSEYLRYYGIRPSDARLQRPEYLGGGKQTISFTEVLQTAPTTSGNEAGVADLKGHGIAAIRTRRYRRFFEEHGYVITLMSVRPRSMYASGLHRSWSRTAKEDFYTPELEHIGQQAVLNKEVYLAHSAPDGTFGYSDRYSEYRSQPSQVVADFRSTLNDWHFARVFSGDQSLNSSFVSCTPAETPFASSTNDVLWCMVRHSLQARRMVGHTGVGRIL